MRMLSNAYPWVKAPFLVSAPMLGATTPLLAANVTRAGGMGSIAGGTGPRTFDMSLQQVDSLLRDFKPVSGEGILLVGVGFQLLNCVVDPLVEVVAKHTPSAVWLLAPKEVADLQFWSQKIRDATSNKTQVWVQVGSVIEASQVLQHAKPDVMVVQGSDAGGHGLRQSASITSLLHEVLGMSKYAGFPDLPILAAGGIVEPRGVAALLVLGASGVVMGTRFLVAEESGVPLGWKRETIRSQDGRVSTTKSTLCDRLKETKGWPSQEDGRSI